MENDKPAATPTGPEKPEDPETAGDIAAYDAAKSEDDGTRIPLAEMRRKYGLLPTSRSVEVIHVARRHENPPVVIRMSQGSGRMYIGAPVRPTDGRDT
ncbi:hypothetical protein LX16_4226 [Stackebrandtia albiflava]|uniref:Uncharacterized protein n=1 Tax=Stackebrandtia albiflava TaxID=406432 RepID=A0A562UYW7_9ACTN|nr:hypothetical protein [Stackebrandtia albiflava]TWJ10802.1 hypothetical protein LX16_4226 [Stackebrandtia albiflava]